MNLLETIASGTIVGLSLWFARKWLREANGFTAKKNTLPVEPFAPKEEVSASPDEPKICRAHPGIDMFRAYVLKRWGGESAGDCGDLSHQARTSDHNVGRAWDWHFPSEETKEDMLAWLAGSEWEWARRLGIGNIINNGRTWASWIDKKGPIARSYKGSNPHKSHVHFSFSRNGAEGKTSGYAMLKGA